MEGKGQHLQAAAPRNAIATGAAAAHLLCQRSRRAAALHCCTRLTSRFPDVPISRTHATRFPISRRIAFLSAAAARGISRTHMARVIVDGNYARFGQVVRLVEKMRANKKQIDKYYTWNGATYKSKKTLKQAIDQWQSDGNGVQRRGAERGEGLSPLSLRMQRLLEKKQRPSAGEKANNTNQFANKAEAISSMQLGKCDCDDEVCVDVSPEEVVAPDTGFEWIQILLTHRVYCGCASCPGTEQYAWRQRPIFRRRER